MEPSTRKRSTIAAVAALTVLSAAGLIEVNGRAVRIPDLERLRAGAQPVTS